jgi:methanogenic corrinoid protein MtbC1
MTLKINEFTAKHEKGRAHNMFIMAMLQFDEQLFNETYKNLTANSTFREVFTGVFLGLLEEIGLLWQTGTITIAHEHFISNLIKQKVLINIEKAQTTNRTSDKTYALFLPDHEIHELGILFIYFELKTRGYHVVYLGQSVPKACLLSLQENYNNIEYISQFTVSPSTTEVDSYLDSFSEEILKKRNEKLHIVGRNTSDIKFTDPSVVSYKHITSLIDSIN